MQYNDANRGIALMIATTFVFAVQDGISQYLASEYNVVMIVMVRLVLRNLCHNAQRLPSRRY